MISLNQVSTKEPSKEYGKQEMPLRWFVIETFDILSIKEVSDLTPIS